MLRKQPCYHPGAPAGEMPDVAPAAAGEFTPGELEAASVLAAIFDAIESNRAYAARRDAERNEASTRNESPQ